MKIYTYKGMTHHFYDCTGLILNDDYIQVSLPKYLKNVNRKAPLTYEALILYLSLGYICVVYSKSKNDFIEITLNDESVFKLSDDFFNFRLCTINDLKTYEVKGLFSRFIISLELAEQIFNPRKSIWQRLIMWVKRQFMSAQKTIHWM